MRIHLWLIRFAAHAKLRRACRFPISECDMLGKHFASKILAAAMLSVLSAPTLSGGKSSYDVVLAGKRCQTEAWNQTLSCEYVVGTGLKFAIAGIGQRDTAVTFMKSSFDGDFYATFGLLHGCVIVKRGTTGVNSEEAFAPGGFADYAFVSPRNGKVYKRWDECKAAW